MYYTPGKLKNQKLVKLGILICFLILVFFTPERAVNSNPGKVEHFRVELIISNHHAYFYWLGINKDNLFLQIKKGRRIPRSEGDGGGGGWHLPFMSLEPVVSASELNTIKSSGSGDDIGQP